MVGVQHCKCPNCRWIIQLKMVNFMVFEFRLNLKNEGEIKDIPR